MVTRTRLNVISILPAFVSHFKADCHSECMLIHRPLNQPSYTGIIAKVLLNQKEVTDRQSRTTLQNTVGAHK
jgi:hypothetical protein